MNAWMQAFEKIKHHVNPGGEFVVKNALLDLYYAGTREGIATFADRLKQDQRIEVFDAMQKESLEEFKDYSNRCGGVPISQVKP